MINLNLPPDYVTVYAKCVDDSLPAFEPEEWIQEGKVYVVKHFAEPLNVTEGVAITIVDENGEEIHPSPSHWSFASHRFELYTIYLN